MNTDKHTEHNSSFKGILALILGLVLPLVMVFSGILMIRAGFKMGSVNDLKTKDYFQSSAFYDDFYTKASDILCGISAREILNTADENFITETHSPSKTLPVLPILSKISRTGVHRIFILMMPGLF